MKKKTTKEIKKKEIVDEAFKTHNSYLPKILKCMKTFLARTLNEQKKEISNY